MELRNYDLRKNIISDYKQNKSISFIANKHKLPYYVVKHIILSLTNKEKDRINKRTKFTPEFKNFILKYMRDHNYTFNYMSKTFGIGSCKRIINWSQRYELYGYDGLIYEDGVIIYKEKKCMTTNKNDKLKTNKGSDKEMERRMLELEAEVAYLKKYLALLETKEEK